MINSSFLTGRVIFSLLSFMILFLSQGCSKKNESIASRETSIKIKSVSESFANANIGIGKDASVNKSNSDFYSTGTQRNTVSLNSDYILVSELVPDLIHSSDDKNTIVKKANVATTKIVKNDVVYKLLVYSANGTLFKELDYVVGPASVNNPELTLPKSASYTFIAVSLNSSILPVVSNKTSLSTATVELSTSPTADLMYYTLTKTLNTDNESNLEINFKHVFSKITVDIDASDTGYDISAVNSEFNTIHLTNSLKLSTMTVTQSGPTSSVPINFNTLNQQVITSNPIIVSAQAGATNSYRISSLTINTIVGSNINLFENMTVQPGVSYTLKIQVTPDDAILDNNTVRINGQVWMRFNLGASGMTAGTSPDLNPGNASLWGNYYRWGDDLPTVETRYNGTTTSFYVPGIYNYVYPYHHTIGPNFATAQDGWDRKDVLGNPVKGSMDPCPSGFRLPTGADFQKLLSSITPSWGQVKFDQNNVYLSTEILTSKRNSVVKMTIPLQGAIEELNSGNIITPQGHGYYLVLQTRDYPTNANKNDVTILNAQSTIDKYSSVLTIAFDGLRTRPAPIRCIKI